MFNLLPYQNKVMVRAEYRRRLIVVGLLLLFLVVMVAVILLFPAYILSVTREKDYVVRLDELKRMTSEEEGGSFAAFLKETTDKLSALSPEKNRAAPADAIIRITQARSEGVHIRSFNYMANKAYDGGTIRVEGKADTREALRAFKMKLDEDKTFTKVDLPVSSFTKEKDIPFAISLDVSFKK